MPNPIPAAGTRISYAGRLGIGAHPEATKYVGTVLPGDTGVVGPPCTAPRLELLDVTEDTASLPDLRGRAGLTTVDVADHLGVHAATYRPPERGRAPLTQGTAVMLAVLFDTTPARVIDAYRRVRADR